VKDQLAEIERAAREAVAIDRQEAGYSFYRSTAATSYGAPPPPPPPPLPPSFSSEVHARQRIPQAGETGVAGEEGVEEEEQGLVSLPYDISLEMRHPSSSDIAHYHFQWKWLIILISESPLT
jgi:hypothetical protein